MKNILFSALVFIGLVVCVTNSTARTAGAGTGPDACHQYDGCRCVAWVSSEDQFGPHRGCCERSAFDYGTCAAVDIECFFIVKPKDSSK